MDQSAAMLLTTFTRVRVSLLIDLRGDFIVTQAAASYWPWRSFLYHLPIWNSNVKFMSMGIRVTSVVRYRHVGVDGGGDVYSASWLMVDGFISKCPCGGTGSGRLSLCGCCSRHPFELDKKAISHINLSLLLVFNNPTRTFPWLPMNVVEYLPTEVEEPYRLSHRYPSKVL